MWVAQLRSASATFAHTLLQWLSLLETAASRSTGESVAEHLPEQADRLVPTLVQMELAKWLTREAGEDKADQVIAFTQACRVMELDSEIALASADACREHNLAAADAVIFATARTKGATLQTCDKHFERLPGVTLVEKIKG